MKLPVNYAITFEPLKMGNYAQKIFVSPKSVMNQQSPTFITCD